MENKKDYPLQLMLITATPEVACYAEESGVDRIFIDMEYLGKQDRQKNLNLPLNQHTFKDVEYVKANLKSSEVMVRINPPHDKTKDEVNKAIDSGADCIMLPYFTRKDEVEMFVRAIDGRCKSNILLETASAVARAESILSLPVNEVHIGLNDLKVTFQLDFLYETLTGGVIDFLSSIAKKNDISFGFGGVGSLSKGSDIPPDLIIKEHVRVGSQRVILSRAFTGNYTTTDDLRKNVDLAKEVQLIRNTANAAVLRSADETEADREFMFYLVDKKVYSSVR